MARPGEDWSLVTVKKEVLASNPIDESHIEALIEEALLDAAQRADAAAYSGDWGDRGARTLRSNVYYFLLGRHNRFPKEWECYSKKLDPEYELYLRLKEKFS